MHGMHEMREMHEGKGAGEEAKASWVYYGGTEYTPNPTQAASSAKSAKKAARTYTNDDVQRQNQNNGNVKYNGKTEKL